MRRKSGRSRNRRTDWLVILAAGLLAVAVVGIVSAHTASVSMACSAQAGATLRVNGSAYPAGSTYTYSIDGGATSGPLNANTGGTVSYYAGVPTTSHAAVVQFHTSDGLTQYNYTFTPSIQACVAPTPEPTPVPTPEPTPVVTPEPTPVPTPEPTPVVTPDPTPVVTPDVTPAPTDTPVPTVEPTPTGSVAGATGSPQVTAPPTDGLVVTAQTVGTGLAAIVGAGVILLIALVLLTPARRRRPVRR